MVSSHWSKQSAITDNPLLVLPGTDCRITAWWRRQSTTARWQLDKRAGRVALSEQASYEERNWWLLVLWNPTEIPWRKRTKGYICVKSVRERDTGKRIIFLTLLQKASPPLATSSHPSSVTTAQETPNTFKVRVKIPIPQEDQKLYKRVSPSWQNSSAF